MNNKVTIAVICGTTRKGRLSLDVAEWVAAQGRARGDVDIIFVDPRDFTLPPDGAPEDGRDPRYSEITQRADGFYVVAPEYNHSFSSSLKRLLDSEFGNYKHKPVATAGVSDGPWGGVRACEALLPVYHTMWMVPVKPELYFPRVQDMFDAQGHLKPAYVDRQTTNVQKAYAELIWFARALRAAR